MKATEFGEIRQKMAVTPFRVIQGHPFLHHENERVTVVRKMDYIYRHGQTWSDVVRCGPMR